MFLNTMKRREQWRPVLEAEMKRWSAKPVQQLLYELKDVQAYQVNFNSKDYTVEVQLLDCSGF